ncbi:MAG: UDP-N-acetylglucosamine 2-epimerase (non-hydrolyzing) [bacterium]|nr:MAG: UDP-N-acetylglucosamine 2-epimerase (non-hydrolyzing) [bacterium]
MVSGTRSDAQILCVVGARPNFIKIAPIMRALNSPKLSLSCKLVHTGQHYDAAMKHSFFEQLHIPEPDIDLGVGSASHAVQTAEVMKRIEPVIDELMPDAVLVVGDVNSTIASTLVSVKKGVPVFHVEAGLRSGDRTMPEEINRILTDQISDMLFTTERSALDNLVHEGIDQQRIHFVGNVMIDSLRYNLVNAISPEHMFSSLCSKDKSSRFKAGYGVVTLHRPSNVDDPGVLRRLLVVLREISDSLPLVFPVHPRTRQSIDDAGLENLVSGPQFLILPPLGYREMLGLMKDSKIVLTDSGGMQEETTALGIPCITLRENTERPITVEEGTNTITGSDPDKIMACFNDIMASGGKAGHIPELWDGKAAERIASIINDWSSSKHH